jgi:hypothetical protein
MRRHKTVNSKATTGKIAVIEPDFRFHDNAVLRVSPSAPARTGTMARHRPEMLARLRRNPHNLLLHGRLPDGKRIAYAGALSIRLHSYIQALLQAHACWH